LRDYHGAIGEIIIMHGDMKMSRTNSQDASFPASVISVDRDTVFVAVTNVADGLCAMRMA
jgi:tellurite resistance-related uncharacterized protein